MLRRDLTRGPLFRQILSFGAPLWLGMTCHVLFNLVNLIIVGRVGPEAVAAVHVASTINFIPMIAGNGITVACVALASERLGARDIEGARRIVNRSHVLMVWLGLVFTVAGVALAGPAVRFQSAQGAVAADAQSYLVIMSAGTPAMFLLMQVTTVLRIAGSTGWFVVLVVGSNLLNLVLDIVLIFGWRDLHIPAMGVPGAAWSTLIARAIGGLVGARALLARTHPFHIAAPGPVHAAEERRELLLLGMPQSLQMIVRAAAVIYLTRVVGAVAGREGQCALSVGTRLDTLLLFGAGGWSTAATAIVGQCLGAGRRKRARQAARLAAVAAGAVAVVSVALMALLARPLLRLFVESVPDAHGVSYEGYLEAGLDYLRIAILAHPFACAAITLTGALNGAKVMVPPLLLDILGLLCIQVPLVSFLGEFGFGLMSIWWALVLASVVLLVAYVLLLELVPWWRRGRRVL